MKTTKTNHYYIVATLWQSILRDLFTTSTFIVPLIANYYILDKRWYIDIFFLIFASLWILARATRLYTDNKIIIRFDSKQKLIEHLKNENIKV